jgi:hypothetical protein
VEPKLGKLERMLIRICRKLEASAGPTYVCMSIVRLTAAGAIVGIVLKLKFSFVPE